MVDWILIGFGSVFVILLLVCVLDAVLAWVGRVEGFCGRE